MRCFMCPLVILAASILAMLPLTACEPEQSQAQTDHATASSQIKTEEATSSAALDPAATLAAMLDLAEAGDWSTYVGEFYGEQHKFSSDADRHKLVSRFEGSWGPKVVEGLRQATTATPTIEADGSRAVFVKDGQPIFMLYKSDDGHWTFHL